jgi:hypothetical protein
VVYETRKCVNCGDALTFSSKGQSRGRYCSSPECKRVRDAERKRVQRAGKPVTEAPPAEPDSDGRPSIREVLEAPTVAPWGEHYSSLNDLWFTSLARRDKHPSGRDYFSILCEAADKEPHRYPSPSQYWSND